MKNRHVFFLAALLAPVLCKHMQVAQAADASRYFASLYVGISYEDLARIPSHVAFLLPYVLLALASSDQAISLHENRSLVQGRFGGRNEFSRRLISKLAGDTACHGFLHIAILFMMAQVSCGFQLDLRMLEIMARTFVLNIFLASCLFFLSLLMERNNAVAAWFAGSSLLSSLGLIEMRARQPFLYRFNLFVSCLQVDDRIFSSPLAIVIGLALSLVFLWLSMVFLMKEE